MATYRFLKLKMFFLLILVFALSGCTPDNAYLPMNPSDSENVIVEIPAGSSVMAMGNVLTQAGLIRDSEFFKTRVKELGVDSKLKAGRYAFQLTQSMDEMIAQIVSGVVYRDLIKVTIPEGYEIKQIVETLVKENLVEAESFYDLMATTPLDYPFLEGIPEGKTRLEGFLFPSTYTFEKGVSQEDILKAMLDKFNTVFKPEYYERSKELKLSIFELITMASIIEREGKVKTELPLVSSVFYNRIQKEMKLESCATIQYALGERKEKLYNKDLEIESPYNTYKYTGLPSGPIASPGEAALKAALFPEESDFLFFVLSNKGDGSHVFTKTYAEHMKAKKANE